MPWITVEFEPSYFAVGQNDPNPKWTIEIERDGTLKQVVKFRWRSLAYRWLQTYEAQLSRAELEELDELIAWTDFERIQESLNYWSVCDAPNVRIQVQMNETSLVVDGPFIGLEHDQPMHLPIEVDIVRASQLWNAIDRMAPYRLQDSIPEQS